MPLIDRETETGKSQLHDAYPGEGKVEYESQLRLVVGCIVAKVHMADMHRTTQAIQSSLNMTYLAKVYLEPRD